MLGTCTILINFLKLIILSLIWDLVQSVYIFLSDNIWVAKDWFNLGKDLVVYFHSYVIW